MKRTWSLPLVCIMLVTLLVACTPFASASEEIVDGRFVKTRSITVEIFDRGNPGGSKPEDNF